MPKAWDVSQKFIQNPFTSILDRVKMDEFQKQKRKEWVVHGYGFCKRDV